MSDSEQPDSDNEAEQEAVVQPVQEKPGPSSRLVDWLTMPGQVMGYSYNGHDVGSDAEIKVRSRQDHVVADCVVQQCSLHAPEHQTAKHHAFPGCQKPTERVIFHLACLSHHHACS